MSQLLETPLAAAGQVDWDAILDSAFQMGNYSRVTRVNDWTVVTGMQVDFPEVWNQAPSGSTKLLVLADTINFAEGGMRLIAGTSTILMGRVIAPKAGAYLFLEPSRSGPWDLYFGLMAPDRSGIDKLTMKEGRRDSPIPAMNYEWIRWYQDHVGRNAQAARKPIPSSVPVDSCKAFLTRMHLGALSLVNDQKPELAFQLFDRLQQLLLLFPGDSFTDLRVQATASRELMQPLRPVTDFVPYLSPDMYADLAEKYSPALKAYADTFTTFADRTIDVTERQAAARIMLNREKNANKFQALVTTQLDENLRIANENVSKATTSMGSQQNAVNDAKTVFQDGMRKFKEQKEREAAMAIASAAISFISGIASIFSGNPNGAAAAANAAEQVEKAAKALENLAKIMKKLVTIGKVIAKIAELAIAVQKAVKQMESAKDLADRMSRLTAETNNADMEGAPSAGAYWDQLWVELETQLAEAIKQEIEGANEYLKELKVLVIYGRALTTAQAALVPLMQEIARAALQAEIAKSQQKDVEGEIERLKDKQAISAEAAAMLWIRYKTVQRSMLIALQNFDAAHRYWALSDVPAARDVNRPIVDMAGDLLEIANIKERQHAAFESFDPKPGDFTNVPFAVPQAVMDQFLKTGGPIALRFTSLNSPVSGWSRVGRVRVDEIYVWVEWKEGKRPPKGIVGFRVRSNGVYADQRLDHGEMRSFCFTANPVNFTFRYNLENYSDKRRDAAIISHAAVAEKFRAAYSEPTLFTEWQLSLLAGEEGKSDTLDRAALVSAMSGITVKFTGTIIDDPGLAMKRARLTS